MRQSEPPELRSGELGLLASSRPVYQEDAMWRGNHWFNKQLDLLDGCVLELKLLLLLRVHVDRLGGTLCWTQPVILFSSVGSHQPPSPRRWARWVIFLACCPISMVPGQSQNDTAVPAGSGLRRESQVPLDSNPQASATSRTRRQADASWNLISNIWSCARINLSSPWKKDGLGHFQSPPTPQAALVIAGWGRYSCLQEGAPPTGGLPTAEGKQQNHTSCFLCRLPRCQL